MTTKPVRTPPDSGRLPPLPDPPRKWDMQEFLHYDRPAVANTLARRLDALRPDTTTFVAGRGYLCRRRSDLPRCPYPDLVVAFNVDAADIGETNGYVIDEAGKPPDFVLEFASEHTARRDYIVKRPLYAGLDVPEYWRFDHTGGRQYDAALAGDRLTPEGVYRPIELTTEADGVIWGYSEALGLSVCWVERHLRFWDRMLRRYLPNPSEMADELDSERRARREETARADAEAARVRELQEEIRRIRGE